MENLPEVTGGDSGLRKLGEEYLEMLRSSRSRLESASPPRPRTEDGWEHSVPPRQEPHPPLGCWAVCNQREVPLLLLPNPLGALLSRLMGSPLQDPTVSHG